MSELLTPEEKAALAQAHLDERKALLWVAKEQWLDANRWKLRLWLVAAFAAGFLCHGWLP
jgi:hypothetical protein